MCVTMREERKSSAVLQGRKIFRPGGAGSWTFIGKRRNARGAKPSIILKRMFAPEDLLAGKMHALLCRRWKHRVKGRDWYDLVWFAGKEIPLHVAHLEARMRQTGNWSGEAPLTESDARQRLHQAIHDLDIEAAKKDVSPFLRDKSQLELWSHDFFRAIAEMIRFV